MKCTATEEQMYERRLERLRHVTFFTQSEKVPVNARRVLALGATVELLTSYFRNSYYQAALHVFKKALEHSWMEREVAWRVWWYRRVLKLSEEEIDERF